MSNNVQKLPTIPKELDPAFQVDPKNPKASPVGFNVTEISRTALQQWADFFYQMPIVDPSTGKMVQDPETNQPKRMLDSNKVGLLVKTAVFAYLHGFVQVIKYNQEQQQQAQQQQQQQGSAYG